MHDYSGLPANTQAQENRILREIGAFTAKVEVDRKSEVQVHVRVSSTGTGIALNMYLPADEGQDNWSLLACIIEEDGTIRGEGA